MTQTLDSPEQYSVAWIAALSIERAAATALLDERHDTPSTFEQHQHDGNSYTWGRMGKHNVVIASLPAGVYGTNAAATTVAHLLSSLPHIKIGLLVGIGGGVPQDDEDTDIRLGDVVVSQPSGTSGGVTQYDLVKAKAGATWERKGALNKPPKILLSSLSNIQAEHEISPSKIPDILEEMWKSNPQMKTGKKKAPAYVHQGFENDRLFQTDYDHVGGRNCSHCIAAEEVQREYRDSTDPEIHYGLIASGNTLVKDAKERDWILDNVAPGCICFEMEAAGLMDSFPCLVIRGICDYADSHKNDTWQRYAAATAAAFAKEFLGFVPVPDLRRSPGAMDLISSMGQKIEQKVEDLKSSIVDAEHKRILDALPVAEDALFDSEAEAHRPTCFENTRVELLKDILDWAETPHARSKVFWLRGVAGTGKSTISRSVAQRLKDRGSLGATFFFKRGWGDCGSSSKLVTTIARQLASRDRAVAMSIRDVVDQEFKISSKSLDEQFDKLIVDPLTKTADASGQSLVIVIDALDECDFGDEAIKKAKRILGLFRRAKHLNFKIFITSRPEVPIKVGFELLRGIFEELVLHDIPESVIRHDIAIFLKRELGLIRQNYNDRVHVARHLPDDWPGTKIDRLAEMAVPLFIFAATMCRLIGEQRVSGPHDQLSLILESQTPTGSNMDATYLPVMHHLISGLSKSQERQVTARFAEIVAPIVVLASPLSPKSLSRLLDVPLHAIGDHLDLLHSVLRAPDDLYSDVPVQLYHQSFRDFLVDPEKQQETRDYPFWVDEQKTHYTLAVQCLRLLSHPGALRRNVCHLDSPGARRAGLSSEHVNSCLPAEVQYACQYWTFHCEMSGLRICEGGIVETFLAEHLLYWVEALAILGRSSEIAGMARDLAALLDPDNSQWLGLLLEDLRRLILRNWVILDEAPLQVYSSTLVFAPMQSVVRNHFEKEMIPLQLHPDLEEDWGACWATLEHGTLVCSIAVSIDSSILASGSLDGSIKLWDLRTGACVATNEHLSGSPASEVSSLAFSANPSDTILASGSSVGHVTFWDAETFESFEVIEGGSRVEAIRFSPDSSKVAILYDNNYARVFETTQYTCIWALGARGDLPIQALDFSHDSLQVASLSRDNTLSFWDSVTGTCLETIQVDVTNVSLMAFSRVSNLLASTSDEDILLWDSVAREPTVFLRGHDHRVISMDFSPFTPTLVSGSYDKTIRLWDTTSAACVAVLSWRTPLAVSVVSLGDRTALASCQDSNVKLWDAALTTENRPGVTHEVHPLALSLDRHDRLAPPSGKKLISYAPVAFSVWNTETGACEFTMNARGEYRFSRIHPSPDGSKVAVIPDFGKRRVLDSKNAQCTATLDKDDEIFDRGSVAFSPNSNLIAILESSGPIQLWNLDSGECTVRELEDKGSEKLPILAFSHDASLLVLAGVGVQLLETTALSCAVEMEQVQAEGDSDSVAFSGDSSLIAVGHSVGDVALWDTQTGARDVVLKGHLMAVFAVAFNGDSTRLASGSRDRIVRLWNPATATCIAKLHCFSYSLSFNDQGNMLQTERGVYVLEESQADVGSGVHSEVWHQIVGISSDLDWIRWRGKDVIWVPPEYRPSAIYLPYQSVRCVGSTMVLATGSGRIIFLKIKEQEIFVDGLW